jgi:precorrin-6B methylase 2
VSQSSRQEEITERIIKKYRSDGLTALISSIIRKIIVYLLLYIFGTSTRRIGIYNGVAVRSIPLLADRDMFEHEEQLMESIRNYLTSGENVVLIGAGTGASSVCAARQVGSDGMVSAYEASKNAVSTCKETYQLNKVEHIANCKHAVVETEIHVAGSSSNAEQLSATDLPNCDALVMDCEGAEKDILKNMSQHPNKIIVETHSHFNSSTNDIKKTLSNNYNLVNESERSENIDVLTFEQNS